MTVTAGLPAAIAAGDIFSLMTEVRANHLVIGGCDVADLAAAYGTPLYVFDEAAIVARARAFRDALARSYPGVSRVSYAAKAYAAPWLLRLLAREGCGLDVVSGGELRAAMAADFPRERIALHGNNKGADELALALEERVGRIVVDNREEIELLADLAARKRTRAAVLLRVGPGVDPHAPHGHLSTGELDSKFGVPIATGQAAEAVRAILANPSLDLRGLHFHLGSQLRDLEPYRAALDRVLTFAAKMTSAGFALRELSPGGGYAVRYTTDDPPEAAAEMAGAVAAIAASTAAAAEIAPLPSLTVEPGRAMIAPAAVALYRVGSVKEISGVRTYVAIDGGMADNIRPTAYGARYTAVLANRVSDQPEATVSIAGKYCETGDVLIRDARLPLPRAGDLIAVASAGAYQLSMASNYNMALRPAAVAVRDGAARLVRRRETFDDLLAAEAG